MINEIDGGFPVYILDDDTVIFLEKEIDHVEFWEKYVSLDVAKKNNVSTHLIKNLPYCQRRGRVVLNNFYCGEKISKKLLKKIESLIKRKLVLVYDEHETRCSLDVHSFKSLIPHIN